MIRFDNLPTNKPTNTIETGTYYATIEQAEMKQGQDPTKVPYLNMVLALKDASGKSCGKIYDILSESDKPLVQFKIARFLLALGLDKLGDFELADLIKVIKNKQLIVDVKQEEAKEGYPAKTVVDVFKGDIYYPMSDAKTLFGNTLIENPTELTVVPDEDADLTINASDAADMHAIDDDNF